MKTIELMRMAINNQLKAWEEREQLYRESIRCACKSGVAAELIAYAEEVRACEEGIRQCKEKLELLDAVEYDIAKEGTK